MSWWLLLPTWLSGAQANALDPDLPEWILGVNEGVSIPPALSQSPDSADRLDVLGDILVDTGARHVRLNTSSTPRFSVILRQRVPDWTASDEALQRLGSLDIGVIIVVAPWPANDPWNAVDNCAIDNPDSWTRRVEKLVERYDGDGVQDVPGTARVIAWEIDNEPDLHEQMRPGFCPPAMHVETVAVTAAFIACTLLFACLITADEDVVY